MNSVPIINLRLSVLLFLMLGLGLFWSCTFCLDFSHLIRGASNLHELVHFDVYLA